MLSEHVICPPEPSSQPILAHHQPAHPKPHLPRAPKCLYSTKGTSERRSRKDVDGGGCFFRTKDWDRRSGQVQVNMGTSQCWKVSSHPAGPFLSLSLLHSPPRGWPTETINVLGLGSGQKGTFLIHTEQLGEGREM